MRIVGSLLGLSCVLLAGCAKVDGSRSPSEDPVPSLSALQSTLDVSPSPATVGSPIDLVVTARDDRGKALAGVAVHIRSSSAEDSIAGAQGVTGGDGIFAARLTSDTLGMRKIVAEVGESVSLSKPLQIYGVSCPGNIFAGGSAPVVPLGPCSPILVDGDFDEDGIDDLLAVRPQQVCSWPPMGGGSLVLYRGRGDGTLEAGPSSPILGGIAVDVKTADLDGDGRLDVVIGLKDGGDVGPPTMGAIAVMRGKENGSFEQMEFRRNDEMHGSFDLGDIDGDGVLDLIARFALPSEDGAKSQWYFWLGRGDATFGDEILGPTEQVVSEPWVAGKLRSDANLDLVWRMKGKMRIFHVAVDGSFVDGGSIEESGTFWGGGDWNRDELLDLAFVENDELRILFARAEGGFDVGSVTIAGKPQRIALSDLNGDGNLDLSVSYQRSGGLDLAVYLGKAGGGFRDESIPLQHSVFDGFVAGRFRDGAPASLLMVGGGGRWLGSMLDAEKGLHLDGSPETYGVGPSGKIPSWASTADTNGDGSLDLIVLSGDWQGRDGTLWILEGRAIGGEANPIVFEVGETVHAIHAADLNGDGATDVVLANDPTGTLLVRWGVGDSASEDDTFQPLGVVAGFAPAAIVSGDWNGDGWLDLAITGSATKIYFGGAGGFDDAASMELSIAGRRLAAGDLDGDGSVDLAILGSTGLERLKGDGSGGFDRLSLGSLPEMRGDELIAADLDADGRTELLILQSEQVGKHFGRIDQRILLVSETGEEILHHAEGELLRSLVAADVDWDGRVDLLVADGREAIGILRGRGGGHFEPLALYPAGGPPIAVLPAEVKGGETSVIVVGAHNQAYPMPIDCDK